MSEQINQIDLANFKADILRLNEELAAKLRENQSLNLQIEHLQNKTAEQSSSLAHNEKTAALLKQSLEKAESELQVASNKMDLLTDEIKVVLQEKAILLGQLKQLQNSIQ